MFANQVKNVRIQLEMSQKKLANALGVSFATINRWENSRNEPSQLDFQRRAFFHLEIIMCMDS